MTVTEVAEDVQAEVNQDFDEIILGICDAECPAQAYVRMTKETEQCQLGIDLCGHHFAFHEAALKGDGWEITIDRREELTRRQQHLDIWAVERGKNRGRR